MVLRHLTDTEVQDYLDGNLSVEQTTIVKQHLESCKSCQNEFNQYQNLYLELKNEKGINLSPNFSKSVITKIRQESPATFYLRFRDIFLSVLGLLIAFGITFYVVDFKPLIKEFTDIFKPLTENSIVVFSNIQEMLPELNMNISLFVLTVMVLLIIVAVDHFIFRHKDKLFAFLRTPTIFCHL